MTQNEERLLAMIATAARARRMAPTNKEICAAFGWASFSSAAVAIKRLERKGRIKVTRYQTDRVIAIPQLGLTTAPPPAGVVLAEHSAKGAWTAEMEERLRTMAAAKTSVDDAAEALGITVSALHGKAGRLGVSFTRQHRQPVVVPPANRPRPATLWTEERLQILRAAAAAGRTAPEVAAQMGLKAAQVSDAARKYCITMARGKSGPALPHLRMPANVIDLSGKRLPPSPPVVTDAAGGQSPVPAMNMPAPAAPRKVVSFFRTCQWIYGDPACDDSCKCGAPTAPGRPYCEGHTARAYVQPGTRTADGRRIGASRDRMGLAV